MEILALSDIESTIFGTRHGSMRTVLTELERACVPWSKLAEAELEDACNLPSGSDKDLQLG